MEIVGNKITKIEESDIVNGTFSLPPGVTIIDDCACVKNKKITKIPYGVTEVGVDAFESCTLLEEMPDSIKSIGMFAFASCISLKNVSKGLVKAENGAFQYCQSLESIPYGIVSVGTYAFANCSSLKEIPDSVKIVGKYGFLSCSSLERMPDSIESADESSFENCTALKNVSKGLVNVAKKAFQSCVSLESIPYGIVTVGDYAFYDCSALKEIPDSITTVGNSAFSECSSLKKLSCNMTYLDTDSFSDDTLLDTISIGNNLEFISSSAFYGVKLEKIITPYGTSKIVPKRWSASFDIIGNYLYLYANSILKEPYKTIEDFYESMGPSNIFNSSVLFCDSGISKFKILFSKTRKEWDISYHLFRYLNLETAKKFQLKTFNEIKDLFWQRNSEEISKAFAEIIEVFGVFETDHQKQNRLEMLKRIFMPNDFIIVGENFENITESYPEIRKNFEKITTPYYYHNEDIIPAEFQIYLKPVMSERYVHRIKKLTGNYGKRINDYIKNGYKELERDEYRVKEGIKKNKERFLKRVQFFLDYDLDECIDYGKMHRIFDGCDKEFNLDFYEFLIENWLFILVNTEVQAYIKEIQKQFVNIQTHCVYTSGNKKVTLKQAVDYIKDTNFQYHPGNEEIAKEVQKSGVVSQEAFDYYQEAFEKNQKRRKTSLIKRKNIYDIDGFKIKAELLRKDEIEAALVGEVNNTNCCQRYGGAGHNCMAHAVYSDDGGVFVTKLIEGEQEILLTQSWDWQNNNVYCHDNIESTPYLDKDKKLREAVAKVFQMDGEFIIEKSKNEVENYIMARRKTIERSLMSEVEKEKEFSLLREMEKRQVIRVVTSGAGNDDLGLSEYFTSSIQVNSSMFLNGSTFTLQNFQPVTYNNQRPYFDKSYSAYTDSDERQYIIAGSLENLCLGKQEPLVPIYRDERRVVVEEKVRDYTFHKVQTIEKEAYPEKMRQYQNVIRDSFTQEEQNVYLGEDWYMIYEKKNDQTIYISDLAKINPSIEDENGEQIREMSTAINNLLGQYEVIEADLKEDTSYLLYLMNKKRGIVEQIGEDKVYSFDLEDEQRVVDSKEQEKILKNIKEIREEKNPELRMHHVVFKKGPRFEENSELKQSTRGK